MWYTGQCLTCYQIGQVFDFRCALCWHNYTYLRKVILRGRFGRRESSMSVLRSRPFVTIAPTERWVAARDDRLLYGRAVVETIYALHRLRREDHTTEDPHHHYYIMWLGEEGTSYFTLGFFDYRVVAQALQMGTIPYVGIRQELVRIADNALKMVEPAWTTDLNILDVSTVSRRSYIEPHGLMGISHPGRTSSI